MKCLSQQLFHDLPANVGEPEIASHVPVSQTLVFKPQTVKDRGLQIVDVDFVFHNIQSEVSVISQFFLSFLSIS